MLHKIYSFQNVNVADVLVANNLLRLETKSVVILLTNVPVFKFNKQ